MRLEDYQQKNLREVYGLYKRGESDQIPENYFSSAFNLDYNIGEWKTRSGLTSAINLGYGGKVRRFVNVAHSNANFLVLILDDVGNFYTYSTRADDIALTPRLTISGATDFSAIVMLGHIYIAFHDGYFGLSGVNLKLFIPGTTIALDEFRDAAGLAPVASSAVVATDGAVGLVNAGTYKIAVAYETTSGFVTQPGPKIAGVFTATSYIAPGSKKIDLSNIPLGPAGTSKRQILITKAGLEEYFFVATAFGGVISDNTTTTATLNFDDITDLVTSADYLFDLLETIPSPLALQDYGSRLVTGGEYSNNSIIRISSPGEPERMDSIDGLIAVNKDDGFSIRNMFVLRDSLYVNKNLGLWAFHDNADVPSSWNKPTEIDSSMSATPIHGIGGFFEYGSKKVTRDWTLMVGASGIVLFDGIIRKPPITDFINDLWQTINFTYFNKIVLAVDETQHKIYCAFPTKDPNTPTIVNTENDTIIMGDYNNCGGKVPTADKIKWSTWQLKPGGSVKRPTTIGIFGASNELVPKFKLGSLDGGGKIWTLDHNNTTNITDDGTDIESYFETALLFWTSGMVHFFTAARLRVIGTGILLVTISGEDSVLSDTIPSILLSSSPGSEKLIRFNFQNEKAKIKFRLTSGRFVCSSLTVFGKEVYTMRPA